jgi:hypothetical protein
MSMTGRAPGGVQVQTPNSRSAPGSSEKVQVSGTRPPAGAFSSKGATTYSSPFYYL